MLPALLVDQDRRVEAPRAVVLVGEFGVAEVEADAELARGVEQRLRLGAGHRALEERVDLGLLLEVPAREERRQREFREHDEVAAVALGVAHQREHALDDLRARLAARDRAELGGADGDDAGHGAGAYAASSSTVCSSTSAPAAR